MLPMTPSSEQLSSTDDFVHVFVLSSVEARSEELHFSIPGRESALRVINRLASRKMALKARIENGIVYSPYPSEPVPQMSLFQVVRQCLEQHGNRTAVAWEDEEVTFAELLKMFQQYAAGFQRHGVKRGEKVLVHLDNSLENMIAMYSVVFAGGVAVLSEPILSNENILHMIQDSDATHILTTASEASRFCDMREKLDMKGCFTTGTAPGFVSATEFKELTGIEKMLDTMKKHKVTTLFGSVPWIVLLAKTMEKEGIRLDSLKTVSSCSVKLTDRTLSQLEPSFDLNIVKNTYGTAEIGGVCKPPMNLSKWNGIGFPSPMVQMKVVDIESGKVLGPNESGELLVKSPTSMRGYYGNPEATSQAIILDGWVRTGDICYYDEEGRFFYVERMSQFFRCMGINVASSSIENVLLSHEEVEEAAVIGVPHPRYEEAAMAFVVLKTSREKITEAALQKFVADKLGNYMHLHAGVKFVDKIPKDANGKVIRKKLRILHGGD
ncbi:4-coumarate--CoA ligase 1 [Ixodes scapularis]